MKTTKLYLFGDSICFGQLVSSYKTWASSLATALEKLNNSETRFLVQNAGVNGNTTRQALERLYYDVISHSPKYVLIQFGMNDCNYWETDRGLARVSPTAFMANLKEIVRKCEAAGVKRCFINTNHPSAKGPFRHACKKTYDESNHEYNILIRDVVKSMGDEGLPTCLFDIEEQWVSYLKRMPMIKIRDLLLEDGIHLSEAGHKLYVEKLVPKIISEISINEKIENFPNC